MDGARWDTKAHCVADSLPKVLHTEFPVFRLVPVAAGQADHENRYCCPVYKESSRRSVVAKTGHGWTNKLMDLHLPMAPGDSEKKWIKRGVALLTMLDH